MSNIPHPASDRFWPKVTKTDTCWLWTGVTSHGHGYFWVHDAEMPGQGRKGRGRKIPAHVWAWEDRNGPITKGLVLDHLCQNRPCVNPSHLEPVTQGENFRRGMNKPTTWYDFPIVSCHMHTRIDN